MSWAKCPAYCTNGSSIVSRNKESAIAAARGDKHFISSKPCRKHPNSPFYVSSRLCVACTEQVATYWETVKDKYNEARRLAYNQKAAKKMVAKLVDGGMDKALAEAKAAYKYQVDPEILRGSSHAST